MGKTDLTSPLPGGLRNGSLKRAPNCRGAGSVTNQADDGGPTGEDPDGVGAAADFPSLRSS
jgi:hypothetical protein